MKKIVFGITSLCLGGAERVLVDIVNKLCTKNDITIFTLYGNGEFQKQLDKKVKLLHVYDSDYYSLSPLKRKWISVQMACGLLRNRIYNKYIKDKFDIEIAFLEGPITWIFSKKSNARKIAWIHNDIEDVFGNGSKAKLKQNLNKKCYQKFDDLVFVSKDNMKKFKKYFPDNENNKQVIYNYLNCEDVLKKADIGEASEIKDNSVSFVQVSRIVEQKALFRLLEVHKKLIADNYKHTIYIVGDGPLIEELEEKIKEYKLSKSFVLLGKKENPYPYIKKSDYFMLTSFYEGYPMVLLEGKALNKYILLTDSAARETLIDYDPKMIVSNTEEGIYDGIKKLIEERPKVDLKNTFDNNASLEKIIKLIEGE